MNIWQHMIRKTVKDRPLILNPPACDMNMIGESFIINKEIRLKITTFSLLVDPNNYLRERLLVKKWGCH